MTTPAIPIPDAATLTAGLTGHMAALAQWPQFIRCKLTPSVDKPGKFDKIPIDANGQNHSAHDPAIWLDLAGALLAAERGWHVGFVLTDRDPLFCVDVDEAIQPDNTWSPIALHMFEVFAGCAFELSISGRGFHIWGVGALPMHGTRNTPLRLEFYHRARFILLTGRPL